MTGTLTTATVACRGCGKNEAACMTQGPCCPRCTHTFDGTTAAPTALRQTPAPAPAPRPANSHPGTSMTTHSTTPRPLLEQAGDIDDPKINRLADKAHQALQALKHAIDEHRTKDHARAEVARLEAELAAAKAKLRGRPATGGASPTGAPKKELSEAQQAQLAKMREASQQPVDCPDCGTTFKGKAGLSAHQRGDRCTGAA